MIGTNILSQSKEIIGKVIFFILGTNILSLMAWDSYVVPMWGNYL